MKNLTLILTIISMICGVHAQAAFPPFSGRDSELACREYQTLLYSEFAKDEAINKEFPGMYRLSVIGGNYLKFQFYQIIFPSTHKRIVSIVKRTLPGTGFIGGQIEFYHDRTEESSSGKSGIKFVSLVAKFSI